MRRRDKVSKTCVLAFRNSVRKCVIAIIGKLLEKSPIGTVIVRNACVFNPVFITSSNAESNLTNKLEILVSHVIKQNWIDPQYRIELCCSINLFSGINLFLKNLLNEIKLRHKKFNSFERSKDRLDELSFFSLYLKCTEIMKSYHQLSKLY